jgi:hypothetical protein
MLSLVGFFFLEDIVVIECKILDIWIHGSICLFKFGA